MVCGEFVCGVFAGVRRRVIVYSPFPLFVLLEEVGFFWHEKGVTFCVSDREIPKLGRTLRAMSGLARSENFVLFWAEQRPLVHY